MFENIFLENDGYGEQKPKKKNTQKKICKVRLIMGFGWNPPEVKRVSGKKFARVLFMCMCVCYGLHLPRKEGKVKILHLPPKKTPKYCAQPPSYLYTSIDILTQNGKMVKGKATATGKQH